MDILWSGSQIFARYHWQIGHSSWKIDIFLFYSFVMTVFSIVLQNISNLAYCCVSWLNVEIALRAIYFTDILNSLSTSTNVLTTVYSMSLMSCVQLRHTHYDSKTAPIIKDKPYLHFSFPFYNLRHTPGQRKNNNSKHRLSWKILVITHWILRMVSVAAFDCHSHAEVENAEHIFHDMLSST